MKGTLREDVCIFVVISRRNFLTMGNISDKNYREHQNTHFISTEVIRKSGRLWDNVEKYGRAKQATDGNIMMRRKGEISMPDN